MSKSEGESLAREINSPFFETSAKDSVNVEVAFMSMARLTKGMIEEDGIRGRDKIEEGGVNVEDERAKLRDGRKKGCCE